MPAKKIDAQQGPTAKWLLDNIEAFLELNDMENDGNYLGWVLFKDRTLVQRLRDGGDVTVTRMDEILAFMKNPADLNRTNASGGLVRTRAFKPLTIKPRELS